MQSHRLQLVNLTSFSRMVSEPIPPETRGSAPRKPCAWKDRLNCSLRLNEADLWFFESDSAGPAAPGLELFGVKTGIGMELFATGQQSQLQLFGCRTVRLYLLRLAQLFQDDPSFFCQADRKSVV